ncbi:MAG: helix-turn-helix transcriptional regulator, partial [Planctomycetota bacterium]
MATPRNSAQEGRSGPEVRETAHNRVDPDRPATPGFGRSLRSAREAAGLTLERLAVACGCARSYLSLMENGRKGPPSEELLARLEIALGLE